MSTCLLAVVLSNRLSALRLTSFSVRERFVWCDKIRRICLCCVLVYLLRILYISIKMLTYNRYTQIVTAFPGEITSAMKDFLHIVFHSDNILVYQFSCTYGLSEEKWRILLQKHMQDIFSVMPLSERCYRCFFSGK